MNNRNFCNRDIIYGYFACLSTKGVLNRSVGEVLCALRSPRSNVVSRKGRRDSGQTCTLRYFTGDGLIGLINNGLSCYIRPSSCQYFRIRRCHREIDGIGLCRRAIFCGHGNRSSTGEACCCTNHRIQSFTIILRGCYRRNSGCACRQLYVVGRRVGIKVRHRSSIIRQ